METINIGFLDRRIKLDGVNFYNPFETMRWADSALYFNVFAYSHIANKSRWRD